MNPNRNTRIPRQSSCPLKRGKVKDCLVVALLTVATVTLALGVPGCRSIVATATESREASAEALRTATSRADSVYVMDSIYVYVTTERTEVTRWRTQWRDRIVHDTVIERHTDTVIRTMETVKESPALAGTPLKRGTRTPGWAWALVGLLAVLVIAHIIRVKNRLNKL